MSPDVLGRTAKFSDPARYFTGDYTAYVFVRSAPPRSTATSFSPSGIIGRVLIIFPSSPRATPRSPRFPRYSPGSRKIRFLSRRCLSRATLLKFSESFFDRFFFLFFFWQQTRESLVGFCFFFLFSIQTNRFVLSSTARLPDDR